MNQYTSAPAGSATEHDERRSGDATIQLVTFNLLGEEFGLPTVSVREIIRMTNITPVPQAPHFVEGVINLRSQIIPVVDLRKRFKLHAKESDDRTRIIVVDINDSALGLVVDGVSEVLALPADSVVPPPPLVANGIGAEYIQGISHYGERMTILVNLEKVFNSSELNKLENM